MANNDAMSRKMAASKEHHAALVDHAIDQLHQAGTDVPAHVGIPAMHALLLAKHFHLKGLKVPEHLQDPPPIKTDSPPSNESGDTEKSSDNDGDEKDGD